MTRRDFYKWLFSTSSLIFGYIYKAHAHNLVYINICEKSRLLPTEDCSILPGIFVEGREPKKYCNIHQKRRPESPKLVVRGRKLYYKKGGTKPITLIGCSPRQLLHSELGFAPPIPYTLEEEIARWIEYGTNYCRVDAVKDYDFTYEFCKRMEEKNIIVELTLADSARPHFGDYRIHIRKTKNLRNIIYEVENEILNDHSRIFAAKKKAEYINSQSLIASGGAWGNSLYGKKHAEEFRSICDAHKIESLHRPYPSLAILQKYIKNLTRYRKPILWNEVLAGYKNFASVPADEMERYARGALMVGANGFNIYNDDFMKLAGKLCREFNQN